MGLCIAHNILQQTGFLYYMATMNIFESQIIYNFMNCDCFLLENVRTVIIIISDNFVFNTSIVKNVYSTTFVCIISLR